MTGAPAVTAKPGAGTAIDSENALALMRWQPVQWHAIVKSGGAVIVTRTRSQRQPPAHGKGGGVGMAAL